MQYYIKERHNPQLRNPYYTALGKMSKKEAKKVESSLYGSNYVTGYSKEEYDQKIAELRAEGLTVRERV